jgi:hypothetical protein
LTPLRLWRKFAITPIAEQAQTPQECAAAMRAGRQQQERKRLKETG